MGTMKEADDKAAKRFLIGATAVVVFIMSMVYLNFPHTYLNDWHKAASGFWKYFSVLPFVGSIVFMWFGKEITWGEKGGKEYGLIAVGLVALGVLSACGWNFDL